MMSCITFLMSFNSESIPQSTKILEYDQAIMYDRKSDPDAKVIPTRK